MEISGWDASISHWFLYPQSVDFTNNTVISEVHTDKSITPFRNSAYLDTCATSFHITVLNIYIKRGNSTCMLKTIYSQNVVWPFPLGIHLWQCVFAICHLPFFCLLLTTSFGCSYWTVFFPLPVFCVLITINWRSHIFSQELEQFDANQLRGCDVLSVLHTWYYFITSIF